MPGPHPVPALLRHARGLPPGAPVRGRQRRGRVPGGADRVRPAATLAIAFLTGFAVMNTEIAAGRLLALSYGTSTTTWALLIGTVLLALAAGNLAGGRLCRRGAPARWLVWLPALAAVLVALLPRLVPLLASGTLARFREGRAGALVAAAAGVAALIALPVALLGAVAPLLLHAAGRQRRPEDLPAALGPLAARLYAAGTA